MQDSKAHEKSEVLLLTLSSLFVGFFVAAELIGSKLFAIPSFGLTPRTFGLQDDEFIATAGIIAFPLTFILTDIINEYFGRRIIRTLTWLAIGVNILIQIVVQLAIVAPTRSFTPGVSAEAMHTAFQTALGSTGAIVVASLIAFAIAQGVDVGVFTFLRRKTGGKMLWLRSQGSTVVSQLIDTFAVIFLAFYVIPELLGQAHMPAGQALTISVTNYVYKFAIAVGITPILYFVHWAVEAYLGREAAHELAHSAHPIDPD